MVGDCPASNVIFKQTSTVCVVPLSVVSCGSLAPVAHSLYDVPEETTYMTTITYDYQEGYKRGVGNWKRTCLENKQWTGTPPMCEGQCVYVGMWVGGMQGCMS